MSHAARSASFIVEPLIEVRLLCSCACVLYSTVSSSFLLLAVHYFLSSTGTEPKMLLLCCTCWEIHLSLKKVINYKKIGLLRESNDCL